MKKTVKKVKRIPFKEFKSIYSKVPRLCVEVVLIEKEGVLLIRRTIEPAIGEWHTPGGTVLKNEHLEEAVKRVAREEIGLEVSVERMLGIIEYVSYKNHFSQDISIAFLVKNISEKVPHTDEHADKFAFFSVLPQKMIKDQKVFYKKVLSL